MIRAKTSHLALIAATFVMAACSAMPSLPSFGGDNREAERAEDKAGRIAMVLEDEVL